MKIAACLSLSAVAVATNVESHVHTTGGPVAEVVVMLKDMQEKSKTDGEEEAKLWSTFKAYCTEQDGKKTETITDLTNSIGSLENRIEELNALGKKLDDELKELEEDTNKNQAAQDEANAIRKKKAETFEAEKQDLDKRIASLEDAVTELDKVQDPTKKSLLLLQLKKDLPQKYKIKATAFLQTNENDPTGGVFGVLKSVLANTKTDLKDKTESENTSKASHDKIMETLTNKANVMALDVTAKQDELANSKEELSTKQGQLTEDQKTKADDESFLANLKEDCAKKSAINEERVTLRKKEDEAIETAIEVLDGDRAAKFFAKSKAASGSFLQTGASIHRHDSSREEVMASVFSLLRTKAREAHSKRLAEVAVLAIPNNPFARVIKAIASMKAQIQDEEAVDKKQLDLCKKNNEQSAETQGLKEEQIGQIKTAMQTLDDTMYKESDGLKDTIKSEEKELAENVQDQRDQTKERREENSEYQTNIRNLNVAHDMLTQAVNVLKAYYEEMKTHKFNKQAFFLQTQAHEDPPEVAAKQYAGQSESGNKVIDMIEGIMKETTEEEHLAHEAEGTAQNAFEDAMKLISEKEADLEKSIKDNKVALATAKQDHIDKEKELESTEQELKATAAFLQEIKPTCDFITTNYDARKVSREVEDKALDTAANKIKDSPAYKKAEENTIR